MISIPDTYINIYIFRPLDARTAVQSLSALPCPALPFPVYLFLFTCDAPSGTSRPRPPPGSCPAIDRPHCSSAAVRARCVPSLRATRPCGAAMHAWWKFRNGLNMMSYGANTEPPILGNTVKHRRYSILPVILIWSQNEWVDGSPQPSPIG